MLWIRTGVNPVLLEMNPVYEPMCPDVGVFFVRLLRDEVLP